VHGQAGKPRPRIFARPVNSSFYALGFFAAGSTVKHLELTAVGTQASSTALGLVGTTADDVIVQDKVSQGFASCYLKDGSVMTNSVCWTPSIQNPPFALQADTQSASSATPAVTLRNVTAVALGTGASGLGMRTAQGYALKVNAVNSVIEGLVAVAYYEEAGNGNGTIEFKPTYSNLVGAGGNSNNYCTPTSDCTQDPSSTNLPGNAIFVNLAGNYHQDPMSPSINRGQDSAANGTTDFDGQPRRFGGRTDIGADELVLPPFATTTAATAISSRAAALTGRANPRGVAGTKAHFEFGRTKAYGGFTPDKPLAQNTTNQRTTSSIGGLKPSARYHYRVVAAGPGGTTRGADRAFTTKGPFAGVVLPQSQTVQVPKDSAGVKATCPASASGQCKGSLALSRKGSKGKRVALGQANFAIPAGKTRKVPVPLNDGALTRLDDRGLIAARASARATDGSGGAPRTTTGKVTLVRGGKLAAGR
jgi:hypothetical protein